MTHEQVTICNSGPYRDATVGALAHLHLEGVDIGRSRLFIRVVTAQSQTLWRVRLLDRRQDTVPANVAAHVPARTRFVLIVSLADYDSFPNPQYDDWREAFVSAVGYGARLLQDSYDGEPVNSRRCRVWERRALEEFRHREAARLSAATIAARAPRARPSALTTGDI